MNRTDRIAIAQQRLVQFVEKYPGNDQMGAQIELARQFEAGTVTAREMAHAFERVDRACEAMCKLTARATKYQDAHELLVAVRATLAFSQDIEAARDLAADVIISPQD